MEEQERPTISVPDGPEPEIFRRLTDPPRDLSPEARITLLWANGLVPTIGYWLVFIILLFAVFVGANLVDAGLGRGNAFRGPDGTLDSYLFGFMFGFNVVLFLGVGIGLVVYGYRKGAEAVRLLRDGELGRARFVGMEETDMQVNERPVMKLRFTFTASDGRDYDAYVKTIETKRLLDDPVEPLFYDSADPNRSVLLDALPGKIRFDEMKQVFEDASWRVVQPLLFGTLIAAELVALVYSLCYGALIPFGP